MASSARIDELRKKFDENPRRYFAPLANEYRKAGEIDQAIAICREYLPQQPGHMSGHIVFGQALYEAKQFEEAKTVFETALTLDPENLIALRHLGDISLVLNDTEGARGWYRRVLEADPRNEEIQAQLARLEQAASVAPTPVIGAHTVETAPAPPPPAPAAKAPPSPSAPTVVMSAVPRPGTAPKPAAPEPPTPPTPQPPVTATSPTAEIVLEDIAPAGQPPAPEQPAAPETIEFETTSMAGEPPAPESGATMALEGLESTSAAADAPPMDSFSLDGLETTSLSAPPEPPAAEPVPDLDLGGLGGDAGVQAPPSEPVAPSAPPEPPAAADSADTLDLDLGALGQPAEQPVAAQSEQQENPDGAATAAPVGEAPGEPSAAPADLEISFPEAPAAAAPAPDPAAQESVPDLDLELPAAAPAPTAPPAPVLSPEPVAEAAAEEPAATELPLVDASAPVEPEAVGLPATAEQESSPFVTETMAELYLQQGHRDEALKVYRALLEQRPDDAALRARIAALSAPPDTSGTSGPTIGDVLRLVALRKPGFRPEPMASNGAEHPPAAGASPVGGDALADHFGFAAPTDADEHAALALAQAFAHNGSSADASVAGAPARPASGELSLDRVFGGQPQDSAPPNFSFDQFFSQRASAEHPAPVAAEPEAAEGESAQDVAQFSQWLDGLKQR